MLTAISGLNAAQADIATTSNNIANVGTVGFHGSRTEFTDVYSSSPYVNPNTKIGSGTMVSQVSKSFAQGAVAATNNTLDLAMLGEGLFVVKTDINGGQDAYTRNGAFAMDRNGLVVNTSGHHLAVFPTSQSGDTLSLTQTQPLEVASERGIPVESKNAEIALNFSSRDMMGSQAAVPPAEFNFEDASTYAYSSPINIFDEEGVPREAMMYYTLVQEPTADDPTTSYRANLVVGGFEVPVETGSEAVVSFDEDGDQIAGLDDVVFTSEELTLNVNMTGSELTQRDFSVSSMTHDGDTRRSLSSLEVDEAGVVWATYGDEAPHALGKVALARFPNMQGLESLGNVEYTQTRGSGDITIGEPGQNGFGRLRSGALEQANVDLTDELVDLITAQRNYQASAKAFETSSALPQSILNIRG
jgi:flagellar hook protein FlgE